MSTLTFPLTGIERQAKKHAILCSVGFLILLPIGVLIGRYTRTLTTRWFHAHWFIQLVVSAPVILAGWAEGYKTTTQLQQQRFIDPHEKIGLALLILYLVQMLLGAFIHFFKFPSVFHGHRPPQNYFHACLGLAILALAAYQVHYGLYTEWPLQTGGLHIVTPAAKHAWLALMIVFWALYVGALVLLPRQYKQEQLFRKQQEGVADQSS